MSQSHRPPHSTEPAPIDDNEDKMGSIRELDFDKEKPRGRVSDLNTDNEMQQSLSPERVREAGMTGASTDDHEPTDDDMSPETLIDEDGARDASEQGSSGPADEALSIVDANEIAGASGSDEEELARRDPLDGKPSR